ncbi:MAG: protein-glutamate O-methyltransferase [Proteobacteria bacterium]|nr:protein-glutamate O-methyltransferase [Pseudomonadota bacterium]MBU1715256.1 protein-glutamate O-methyltransferase [Pseudomonadota bacterium]
MAATDQGAAKVSEPADWRLVKPIYLSDREFKQFSAFIYQICGIKLPTLKKTMLSARLNKRLRQLNLSSFEEYFEYVTSPAEQDKELVQMIDAVSTNKTEFFREAKHFDYLAETVLPEKCKRPQRAGVRTLRVWSAGCSSGEEPYTLAMVLDDTLKKYPWMDFKVLGTDICTEVLDKAALGVYSDESVATVPVVFKHKYLMRGKGGRKGVHRVVPELRHKVSFSRLNFMDRHFGLKEKMDIIFCRNVIIYFDKKTQIELFQKFRENLAPAAYLFTGHSESLEGIIENMKKVESAVYKCPG